MLKVKLATAHPAASCGVFIKNKFKNYIFIQYKLEIAKKILAEILISKFIAFLYPNLGSFCSKPGTNSDIIKSKITNNSLMDSSTLENNPLIDHLNN